MESLRNIAIVAHVDHGKTTLVSQLLSMKSADQTHSCRYVLLNSGPASPVSLGVWGLEFGVVG